MQCKLYGSDSREDELVKIENNLVQRCDSFCSSKYKTKSLSWIFQIVSAGQAKWRQAS